MGFDRGTGLRRLADEHFDVLVVGGGITGAGVALDAVTRGLRTALVERDDFGAATSANSLRIIHGGLRYLARGDFARMRESIHERSALLRIAPGLVEPLPVLIPTGPPGVPSRLALGTALALTHVLSLGRNRDLPSDRRIAAGRLLSRAECLEFLPELATAPETQRAVLDATIEVWTGPYQTEHGLGAISVDDWDEAIRFMASIGMLPQPILAGPAIDDSMLP